MRQKVTAPRLHDFIKALGSAATTPVRIFLVGGATAVLLGWRESTIDVDIKRDSDIRDVQEMTQRGLIEPKRLLELFSSIEDQLYRYPAIDGASFRRNVEQTVAEADTPGGVE